MSLFSWFGQKSSNKKTPLAWKLGTEMRDSTAPLGSSGLRHSSPSSGHSDHASVPLGERQMYREQLYGVVRDVMLKAGVLKSSYKFKVLSLDSQGRQFLVMMELSWLHNDEAYRLLELENLIAQRAKHQCDILVTAVYWRMNECVVTGSTGKATATVVPAPPISLAPVQNGVGFAALQAEEVVAFKQAVASVETRKPLSNPGEIIHSGRRNPAPEVKFQHTEIGSRPSPLSGTQYGDLN